MVICPGWAVLYMFYSLAGCHGHHSTRIRSAHGRMLPHSSCHAQGVHGVRVGDGNTARVGVRAGDGNMARVGVRVGDGNTARVGVRVKVYNHNHNHNHM